MFGNIVFGGGIGALIDHNKGTGYNYPDQLPVKMGSAVLVDRQVQDAALRTTTEKGQPTNGGVPERSTVVKLTPRDAPANALNSCIEFSPDPAKQVPKGLMSAPGDEWEYLAIDEMFGKRQKLLLRVKAVSAEGVLEEIVWNGTPFIEWVFGPRAAAIGTPNTSDFMFAPHWDGGEFSGLKVEGGRSKCIIAGNTCTLSIDTVKQETLTVTAGTFEAIRLDGWVKLTTMSNAVERSGRVTIWYSRDQHRLLKQKAESSGHRDAFKETLELSAIRRGPC